MACVYRGGGAQWRKAAAAAAAAAAPKKKQVEPTDGPGRLVAFCERTVAALERQDAARKADDARRGEKTGVGTRGAVAMAVAAAASDAEPLVGTVTDLLGADTDREIDVDAMVLDDLLAQLAGLTREPSAAVTAAEVDVSDAARNRKHLATRTVKR